MESHSTSSFSSKPEKKVIFKSPFSDPNTWTTKTPEKPIQLPRRSRNRGVALSVKEVRKIAKGLHKTEKGSSHPMDLHKAEDQIDACSSVDSVPKSAKAKVHIKLPEKYEMLAEFFSCLESSIRLLRLKGLKSTFANICPQIETLTDRRFSYGHLAQLKYILPEAIGIEKTRERDERTLCVKPDLKVTLQLDAFENTGKCKSVSGYLILEKMFRARLLDFFNTHPEADEIPEEPLPEPFNRTKPTLLSSTTKTCGSQPHIPPPPSSSPETLLQRPSHMPLSFQRRFSKKTLHELDKAQSHPSTSPLRQIAPVIMTHQPSYVSIVQSPIKCSSIPPTSNKSFSSFSPSKIKLPPSSSLTIHEEETKPKIEDHSSKEMDGIVGTPLKLISTPSKLMTFTPELQTPKRCRLSPDDDSTSLSRLVRRPTRIRSLQFHTPVKNANSEDEENESGMLLKDAAIINSLPETLLQSIREKERKSMEDRDAGVVESKRRQQMIACLPKLFDMIRLIFQSMRRSVMTKQELMYKLVVNCDVDKGETEEQLKLLEELVPDWISGKMSSSGDFLFCINKATSAESIHARLAEAV